MGLEGRTLDMGSANRSFTTDYSLTFGCLELPSYLADEGPQCSPFTCYVKGGARGRGRGSPRQPTRRIYHMARFGGLPLWGLQHGNVSMTTTAI